MKIYKWKWVMLGALRCVNNADIGKKKKNDNIVLDVFIIFQKLIRIYDF